MRPVRGALAPKNRQAASIRGVTVMHWPVDSSAGASDIASSIASAEAIWSGRGSTET